MVVRLLQVASLRYHSRTQLLSFPILKPRATLRTRFAFVLTFGEIAS